MTIRAKCRLPSNRPSEPSAGRIFNTDEYAKGRTRRQRLIKTFFTAGDAENPENAQR